MRSPLLLFMLGGLVVSFVPCHSPVWGTEPRPNILFLLTDDLDDESLIHLPRLREFLTAQGTRFANMFVNRSLCCPSRASILRGQYAHNTQIFGNAPPQGGFETFHALGLEDSTVATWLQAVGYHTVLLGKYLNGYPFGVDRRYIPPGWDEWYSPVGGDPYGEYDYVLNENGQLLRYGSRPADYLTDVLARKATDVLQRAAERQQPVFMYLATYAPHQPATPPWRYQTAFAQITLPRPPSFNELDVSDKPLWVQARPLLEAPQIAHLTGLYRRRLQSMLAVEDLLLDLIQTLQATGQLDSTYIVFSSDNGFHLGQHRLPAGKLTGYEADLRIPLIIRGPGVPAGRVLPHLLLNTDFAPTFAELAGAAPPGFVDGRSLVPLLAPEPPATDAWHQVFLIEGRDTEEEVFERAAERGPSWGVLEPPDPFDAALASKNRARLPKFRGIRTTRYTYLEYATGERELYDLAADPDELENVVKNAAVSLLERLEAALARLLNCQAQGCRAAEDAAP